jgi:hypothetical protein
MPTRSPSVPVCPSTVDPSVAIEVAANQIPKDDDATLPNLLNYTHLVYYMSIFIPTLLLLMPPSTTTFLERLGVSRVMASVALQIHLELRST